MGRPPGWAAQLRRRDCHRLCPESVALSNGVIVVRPLSRLVAVPVVASALVIVCHNAFVSSRPRGGSFTQANGRREPWQLPTKRWSIGFAVVRNKETDVQSLIARPAGLSWSSVVGLQPPAAEVDEELDLVGNPEAALLMRQRKIDLKRTLSEDGLPCDGSKAALVRRILDHRSKTGLREVAATSRDAEEVLTQHLDVAHDPEEEARWCLETVVLPRLAKQRSDTASPPATHWQGEDFNFGRSGFETNDAQDPFGTPPSVYSGEEIDRRWLPLDMLLEVPAACKDALAACRRPVREVDQTDFKLPPAFKRMPLSAVRRGQELRGIVASFTNYGVFVDVGAEHDGMVHISRLTTTNDGFVKHMRDVVDLDEEVTVWVSDVPRPGEFHLSMNPYKKFSAPKEPQQAAAMRLAHVWPGEWLRGVVHSTSAVYGLRIWVDPPDGGAPVMGVAGPKEMPTRRNKKKGIKRMRVNLFNKDQEIRVRVLGLNATTGEVSLTLRDP